MIDIDIKSIISFYRSIYKGIDLGYHHEKMDILYDDQCYKDLFKLFINKRIIR